MREWGNIPNRIAALFLVIGLFGIIPGNLYFDFQVSPLLRAINNFHTSVSQEMIVIGIVTIIFDWANRERQKRRVINKLLNVLRNVVNQSQIDETFNELKSLDMFVDGSLEKANMTGAVLNDVDFRSTLSNRLEKNITHLEDEIPPVLTEARLQGAKLDGANLEGAYLERASLASASLCKTKLAGARLNDANLTNAMLKLADLNGAHLEGADLTGALLMDAKVDTFPVCNGQTTLPMALFRAVARVMKDHGFALRSAGVAPFGTNAIEVCIG